MLNQDAFCKMPSRVRVVSSVNRLQNFSEKIITNSGSISVPVRYSGKRFKNIKFFIVEQGASLLGQDLFDRLGFRIVDRQDSGIRSVEAQPARLPSASRPSDSANSDENAFFDQHASLFKANMRKFMKGSVQKPFVNSLVPPVAQALRRVILELISIVKDEIDPLS